MYFESASLPSEYNSIHTTVQTPSRASSYPDLQRPKRYLRPAFSRPYHNMRCSCSLISNLQTTSPHPKFGSYLDTIDASQGRPSARHRRVCRNRKSKFRQNCADYETRTQTTSSSKARLPCKRRLGPQPAWFFPSGVVSSALHHYYGSCGDFVCSMFIWQQLDPSPTRLRRTRALRY